MMRSAFSLTAGWVCLIVFAMGCSSEPTAPVAENEDSSTPEPGSDPVPSETPAAATKERIKMTPAELQAALEKDRSGKPLYDKEIELSGKINSAGLLGGPFVLMDMVRFDTVEKEPWAKVLPDQQATLLATVTWEEGVMVTIDSTEGERTVIPAEKLGAQIEADKATSAVHWVEVTGEVVRVGKTESGNPEVVLKGDGDIHVFCTFPLQTQDAAISALKPGDQVRIVGSYNSASSAEEPGLNQSLLITE